jgi:hypothetical protein
MAAAWVNIKASESLLTELDITFPNRDRRSDGTIGDTAHAGGGTSDHLPDEQYAALDHKDSDSLSEVHARDIDSDLGRPGWTLARVFEVIRKRCELGQEKRVQNMIVDGKITSATWGWSWRSYGGRDPHDTHGHISFKYGAGSGPANPENITGPWGILDAVQREQAEQQQAEERGSTVAATGYEGTFSGGDSWEQRYGQNSANYGVLARLQAFDINDLELTTRLQVVPLLTEIRDALLRIEVAATDPK